MTMLRPVLFTLVMTAVCGTAAAQESLPSVSFKGLIDLRGVLTDNTRSWEDKGLGKTR